MQWRHGFEATHWAPHEKTKRLAYARTGDLATSVPVETMFHHAKHRRQQRGRVKVSLPTRIMGILVGSKVLEKVHKYKQVPHRIHIRGKRMRLKKENFGHNLHKRKCSVDLKKTAGVQQKAPWLLPL